MVDRTPLPGAGDERTPLTPEVRASLAAQGARMTDGGLQTPSADDLSRWPPGSRACLRIRILLRDHADGDLPDGLRREVADHVHECAACDRALSRAEFEVLRVRGALRDENAGSGPPPGFTGRVLARIREEELPVETDDAAQAPHDFTPRVMERVRKEWSAAPPWWHLRGARPRWAARVALAAAALCIAIGAGWRLFAPPQVPAFTVVEAREATVTSRGDERTVYPGERLEVGAALRVASGGRAVLRLPVVPGTPAGDVTVGGGSRLAVSGAADRPHLEFERGDLQLALARPLRLAVRDNGWLELSAGRFALAATSLDRADGQLSPRRFVRVTLEVESGEGRIVRGNLPQTRVAAAMVAEFDAWSPVVVEPAFDGSLLRAERTPVGARQVTKAQPSPPGTLIGTVVDDRTGVGVAGATVQIRTASGQQTAETDSGGRYALPGFEGAADAYARVTVLPPRPAGGAVALAVHGPAPLRLDAHVDRDGTRTLAAVRLRAEQRVLGTVVDPARQPLAAAALSACVVDELRGTLRRLPRGRGVSAADGSFALGVPPDLGAHERLVVLAEHARYPLTAAILAAAADGDARKATEVRMRAPRTVTLAGLPSGAPVEIVEGVPGVPAGAALAVHRGETDARGELRLSGVGSGPFWRKGEAAAVAVAASDAAGDDEGASTLAAAVGDQLPKLDASAPVAGVWLPFQHSRYEDVAMATQRTRNAIEPGQRQFWVSVEDGTSAFARPGTRLFRLGADGKGLVFLGEYQGEAMSLVAAEGEAFTVVGISPDGAVGVLGFAESMAEAHRSMRVLPTGGAVLAPALRPSGDPGRSVLLRLEMAEGVMAGMVLYREVSAAEEWASDGLLPGTYRVAFVVKDRVVLATCTVAPGQRALIVAVEGR
jgi:hypothetical protein